MVYGDRPSNNDRADWAKSALDVFAKETGLISDTNEETLETIVGDFLCNLRHLCERENIPIDQGWVDSEMMYEEEVEEEADSAESPGAES